MVDRISSSLTLLEVRLEYRMRGLSEHSLRKVRCQSGVCGASKKEGKGEMSLWCTSSYEMSVD